MYANLRFSRSHVYMGRSITDIDVNIIPASKLIIRQELLVREHVLNAFICYIYPKKMEECLHN